MINGNAFNRSIVCCYKTAFISLWRLIMLHAKTFPTNHSIQPRMARTINAVVQPLGELLPLFELLLLPLPESVSDVVIRKTIKSSRSGIVQLLSEYIDSIIFISFSFLNRSESVSPTYWTLKWKNLYFAKKIVIPKTFLLPYYCDFHLFIYLNECLTGE